MPPVLGLLGSGEFTTDERPKNYRSMIMFLKPNTSAPLTAMTGQLKSIVTDDPEFKIFEKDLPLFMVTLNDAAFGAGTTTVTIDESTNNIKVGNVLFHPGTDQVMWVTAVPTASTLTVKRGQGSTAASIADNQQLFVIGNTNQEGASVPEGMYEAPTVVSNFTQIFRDSYKVTRTAANTFIRHSGGDVMREQRRETLERHGIGMEMAFLFGAGFEDTGGAELERATKGAWFFISTNVTDFAGSVTEAGLDTFFEDGFRQGSSEKLLLGGSRAIRVLHDRAKQNTGTQLNLTPKSQTFGLRLLEWITPFGDVRIMQHPLLSKHLAMQDLSIMLDMENLNYRPLRGSDTMFRKNIQAPDVDGTIDEYLTEAGLQLSHEITHSIGENMTAAA